MFIAHHQIKDIFTAAFSTLLGLLNKCVVRKSLKSKLSNSKNPIVWLPTEASIASQYEVRNPLDENKHRSREQIH